MSGFDNAIITSIATYEKRVTVIDSKTNDDGVKSTKDATTMGNDNILQSVNNNSLKSSTSSKPSVLLSVTRRDDGHRTIVLYHRIIKVKENTKDQ